MTVPSIEKSDTSFVVADGVTQYSFIYPAIHESHIEVFVKSTDKEDEETLSYGNDYSVTLNPSGAGGTVTLISPVTSGRILTISRKTPLTQNIDLPNQGPFYAETIEEGLDKSILIAQESFTNNARALKLPVSSSARPDIPDPVAGSVIRYKNDSSGFEFAAFDPVAINQATASAKDSADSASSSATSAADNAASASTSASQASTSMTHAQEYRDAAKEYADKALTISQGNITAGSITTVKLANNAVTTEKLANSAVTTEKLANAAVTEQKLEPNLLESLKTTDQKYALRSTDQDVISGYSLFGNVKVSKINQTNNGETETIAESWTRVARLSALTQHQAVSLPDNRIFMWDGVSKGYFITLTDTGISVVSATVRDPHPARYHFSMVCLTDGRIFVFGGHDNNSSLTVASQSRAYVGTISGNTITWDSVWQNGLDAGRADTSVVVLEDGRLFTWGGRSALSTSSVRSTAFLGSWDSNGRMSWTAAVQSGQPLGQYDHKMALLKNGSVITFGGLSGVTGSGGGVYTVSIANNTATWKSLSQSGDRPNSRATQYAACVLSDGRCFKWGGYSWGGAPNDMVFIGTIDYTEYRISWVATTPTGMPGVLTGVAACATYDNRAFIHGGLLNSSDAQSSAYLYQPYVGPDMENVIDPTEIQLSIFKKDE